MSIGELNRSRSRPGRCPFCTREMPLTFHHLIPKKVHRRKRFKRTYSREALARGIFICRRCHDGIHDRYSEMELAKHLNTPEALAGDPRLKRHFDWVARQRR